MKLQGKIKKIINDRYFGFIKGQDGKDIFFHQTGLTNAEWNDLSLDQEVEYEVKSTPKGNQAVNISLVG